MTAQEKAVVTVFSIETQQSDIEARGQNKGSDQTGSKKGSRFWLTGEETSDIGGGC